MAAKMNMPPFIKITGRDKFVDGKGEKMDEGTLQRFLAEIVWFPSAALSQYITWEAIDSLSAKATMNYKGTNGSGLVAISEWLRAQSKRTFSTNAVSDPYATPTDTLKRVRVSTWLQLMILSLSEKTFVIFAIRGTHNIYYTIPMK